MANGRGSCSASAVAAESFTAAPEIVDSGRRRLSAFAASSLRAAAAFWLIVAVLGQLLLAGYVVGFYGRTAVQGRVQEWTRVLSHGLVSGEPFLNAVLVSHLIFVVIIIIGGALQLVPKIRKTWPDFHRWTGRIYLLAGAVLSVGGLTMVWTRGTVGDLTQRLAVSLNALLILSFAAIAWRHARARQVDRHRRWALRLFLAVSGVWFFRIGLMLWLVLNHGPVGFDPKTFTGPFLSFLGFAQYLLPLAVLELYFRAQRGGRSRNQLAMAAGLLILTVATIGGTAAAAAIMWLPHI